MFLKLISNVLFQLRTFMSETQKHQAEVDSEFVMNGAVLTY